ncbi:unnamed protein product [Ranitomeya imitator]|uniref:STAS domain-containing protein n=1 Tax=Ranitomeya imitator TaxID=111125 RepID=A0ABN9M998_9NEOB|nr:unnamed protein product [Ranitomeya imitator]
MLCERHLNGKSVGRKQCGRKRCTTRRGDRTLRKIVEKDRFQTLGNLRKQWTESGVETSRATVHRRVQEMGYRCRIPQQILHVIRKSRCQSLEKTGEKEMPKCLKSSVKYRQSVMVWGAMSAAGVGPLCFIKGRVNAASYQEILEHFMLPSAEMLYGDEDFIFQHDLAPAHSAKTTVMADPPSPGDLHNKPIFSEAELEQLSPRPQDSRLHLLSRARSKFKCSGTIAKSLLLKFIPILYWLPRYPVKNGFSGTLSRGSVLVSFNFPKHENARPRGARICTQFPEAENIPVLAWQHTHRTCHPLIMFRKSVFKFLPISSNFAQSLKRSNNPPATISNLINSMEGAVLHCVSKWSGVRSFVRSSRSIGLIFIILSCNPIHYIWHIATHLSRHFCCYLCDGGGSVTESLAPSDNFMIPVNESMVLDTVARDAARIQVATALTLLVGIFQEYNYYNTALMYKNITTIILPLCTRISCWDWLQFGFVVTYLSEPLVRGYTTAAAIHVTLSQLKSILGVEISQRSHPLSLIYTIVNLCAKIPQTNVASLLIAVIAIIFMLTVKFLNEKYMAKIRIPIPIELITLIVATGISYGVNLNTMYGVNIVGDIPTGLKAPSVPRIDLLYSVIGNAFAIAVVVYAFTVSLVKMFAVKHGYNVDSNQELIALGISNSVGSFFQCFTIGTAMSRSLVQENTGGNSQIAGAVSSLVILIIILKAGELFESLPKAILASVVVVNLKGIYKQFMDIPALWRSNKIDLMVWLVTFVATILLNLDLGLGGVSGLFPLDHHLQDTMVSTDHWTMNMHRFNSGCSSVKPHYSLLGQVSSTDIYRDVTQYKQALEIPGVKIFRSSCTLYFANAELYANAVKKMCGVDVDKLIAIKKKEAKKKKQLQEKAEKEAKKGLKEKENRNDGNVKGHELEYIYPRSPAVGEAETDRVVVEESTLNNVGSNECPLHSLILDLSTVNFVDTVSIKILKNIFRDFEEIDVSVYLVGCHENVLEQLERGNFFSKTITKYLLFSSIHDAVTYISINYCKKPGEERLVSISVIFSFLKKQNDAAAARKRKQRANKSTEDRCKRMDTVKYTNDTEPKAADGAPFVYEDMSTAIFYQRSQIVRLQYNAWTIRLHQVLSNSSH